MLFALTTLFPPDTRYTRGLTLQKWVQLYTNTRYRYPLHSWVNVTKVGAIIHKNLFICVCMYVYVYVYTCIHIYIYIYNI
jgi:hypothetical protein